MSITFGYIDTRLQHERRKWDTGDPADEADYWVTLANALHADEFDKYL